MILLKIFNYSACLDPSYITLSLAENLTQLESGVETQHLHQSSIDSRKLLIKFLHESVEILTNLSEL